LNLDPSIPNSVCWILFLRSVPYLSYPPEERRLGERWLPDVAVLARLLIPFSPRKVGGIDSCVNQLLVTLTKYLRGPSYKEEIFILAHGFGGFSPWSAGPIAFGLVVRQPIMKGNTWKNKLLASWKPGSKRKR
jgi:hypothetical protein